MVIRSKHRAAGTQRFLDAEHANAAAKAGELSASFPDHDAGDAEGSAFVDANREDRGLHVSTGCKHCSSLNA
jgi:hypothetical protein